MDLAEILESHFKASSSRIGYNAFITVPFVRTEPQTKFFCWNKGKVGEAESFVTAYTQALNRCYFRGSRRVPELHSEWLPMVAVPEYRKAGGASTFLHYHMLALFPDDRLDELCDFTQEWWRKKGFDRLQSPINVRIKLIYDLDNIATYLIKNQEDGFTIERMIVRGQ